MQGAVKIIQDYMGPADTTSSPEYKHRTDGSTMRSLQWFGNRDVRMMDAPIPDISEPKDVIVRVTGTTICGSDLHLLHSEMPGLVKGDILGHEFMGLVERVGPEVTGLKVGDRVVTSFQIACGTCRYCQKKLSSMCENTNNSPLVRKLWGHADAGFLGYGHLAGGWPGGQAEYVRVGFGEVNCLKLPDDVPDEQALWLSDILPTSYHAVEYIGVKEGDVMGAWGLGPVGLCVVKWALAKGVKKIYAIDSVPSRIALAKALDPRVEVIDFSKEDVLKYVQDKEPGGLDVCIDSTTYHEPHTLVHKVQKAMMLETDSPETYNMMILLCRKMGRFGTIGVHSGFANGVNLGSWMNKGLLAIGGGQAPVHLYWETILEKLRTGEFDCKGIVSHRVDIEDMPALYDAFSKRVAGVEKVFVATKASNPPSPGFPQLTKVSDWAKTQL